MTLQKSWGKIRTNIIEQVSSESVQDITALQMAKIANSVLGEEDINVKEWSNINKEEEKGFQLLSTEEIVRSIQGIESKLDEK